MPHFYGAVGAPNVGHHQWQPCSRRPLIKGNGRASRPARAFLQALRRREPAPEYGLRITAVIGVVLIHMVMLFLMVIVRPSGYPPPAGAPEMASVQVRLIPKSKPPPPPPPPIKLPEHRQPVKKAVTRVPPTVKRAPVAAMPPVPQVTPARPEIKVTPAAPTVVQVPTQVPPVPQAAASPMVSAPTSQVELSPTPPKVVLEPSAMAVAPPPLGDVQVAPAKVASSNVQPVPTQRTAPTVELGNPALATVQQGQLQSSTQVTLHAEATMAQVPETDAAPKVHVTVAPTLQPSIEVPVATPRALKAPDAELSPVPQASPATTAAPALNLPLAQVPEPQAPAVIQAPSVRVDTSSVTPAATDMRKQASPVGKTRLPAPSSSSWTAAANDQFKPASGRDGESAASASGGKAGQKQGYVQLAPRGNSNVMSRRSDRLGYTPTMFDQYWAPANESILDTFLRRMIEKLSFKHTFNVAPGVRVHCVVGPLAIFVGCGGDPPRPVSKKSKDPRLNMAPARSLVPDLPAPASASTAAPIQLDNTARCATARVAGSLPPPGCPGAPVKPSQSDQW